MSLPERIKSIRQSLNLTQTDFAVKLNLTTAAAISAWEKGAATPTMDNIIAIAKLGAVTIDWLLTGQDPTFSPKLRNLSGVQGNAQTVRKKRIPVIGVFSGGDPSLIYREDNVLGELEIIGIETDNLFAVEVEGDSMVNLENPYKSIEPGDAVIIDPSIPPVSGDIVAIALESGRQLVKTFIKNRDGSIELRSSNPSHPPMYVDASEIQVMFRVIAVQPRLKRL